MHRIAIVTLIFGSGCADAPRSDTPASAVSAVTTEVVESGIDALLQAVSPVSADVVWASGHRAAVVRSLDGGRTWTSLEVPDAQTLQFRDVAAFDTETAYVMSAGTGSASRVYRTGDGGVSWTLQHTAAHPEAFFDCMDFWTPDRGLVYGDAVDGVPFILSTGDGGSTWARVPAEALPPALEGEGGFAASGTCLVTGAGGRAWIATGNAERARVLSTDDYGASWRAVDAPVVAGAAAGLTTIRMAPDGRGVAFGGQIGADSTRTDNFVTTNDQGASWMRGGALAMDGPVYGSAFLPEVGHGVVVAVGPRGLVWSGDGGASWQVGDTLAYWAAAFAAPERGWAVGPAGRILRLAVVAR